jgi:hypothetical protein
MRLLLIATSFGEPATVFPRLDFPVLASGTSQWETDDDGGEVCNYIGTTAGVRVALGLL